MFYFFIINIIVIDSISTSIIVIVSITLFDIFLWVSYFVNIRVNNSTIFHFIFRKCILNSRLSSLVTNTIIISNYITIVNRVSWFCFWNKWFNSRNNTRVWEWILVSKELLRRKLFNIVNNNIIHCSTTFVTSST